MRPRPCSGELWCAPVGDQRTGRGRARNRFSHRARGDPPPHRRRLLEDAEILDSLSAMRPELDGHRETDRPLARERRAAPPEPHPLSPPRLLARSAAAGRASRSDRRHRARARRRHSTRLTPQVGHASCPMSVPTVRGPRTAHPRVRRSRAGRPCRRLPPAGRQASWAAAPSPHRPRAGIPGARAPPDPRTPPSR